MREEVNLGCFFGKIKSQTGKRTEKIKRILKEKSSGYMNLSSEGLVEIKFNPHYKLDKTEVFYIDYDEEVKGLIKNPEILELGENTSIYDEITSENWKHLDFIVYSEENILYFQGIVGNKYLTVKKGLSFSAGNPILKEEEQGIEINKYPDFCYIKDKQKIYFKDFSKIDKILTGIDELYRTATLEETKSFLNSSFIKTENIDINNLSISKRKKIAQAVDKLKGMNIEELKEYGKKYNPDNFSENKIYIKEAKDIDIALKIIFEKYYTTEVSKIQMEANSVKERS